MAKPLLISGGDVIEVQLTSETVVFQGAASGAAPGHITNRMRLFVRELDGPEKKYDFEGAEIGVRETQRIMIVRGVPKRAKAPVNLMLFNLSSGESDVFEPGFRAFLIDAPRVPAPFKALIATVVWAMLFWLNARFAFGQSEGSANVYSIVSAVLLAPVFWWIARAWDKFSEDWRYEARCKELIADAEGRLRVYSLNTTSTPAEPTLSAVLSDRAPPGPEMTGSTPPPPQ